jgi:hypothetical protein
LLAPAVAALALGGGTIVAGDVAASPDQVRPLLIGAEVPELTLTAADGTVFDMRAAAGEQRAIIVFYRGGW